MPQAILKMSWKQYSTKQQLYGHLPPITKNIQVRRTRHAGHCWRSRNELISDVLLAIFSCLNSLVPEFILRISILVLDKKEEVDFWYCIVWDYFSLFHSGQIKCRTWSAWFFFLEIIFYRSIPGRVIPNAKKMVLDVFLLNTQHHKLRVKWSNPEKGVAPSPTPQCNNNWKESLGVTLDCIQQFQIYSYST